MSSDSKEKVQKILKELAVAVVDVDSIPALADYLGYSKQTLYGWASNGEIPLKSVVSKLPDVNPYFLRTGEGEPFSGGETRAPRADRVDLPASGQLSRDHMKQLLGQIESIARILKDNL